MAGQGCGVLGGSEADRSQLPLQGTALRGPDVAEKQILVRRQPHLQLICLHQPPQGQLGFPLQPTTQQGQTHEPEAIALAVPAQVVEKLALRFVPQGADWLGKVARQFLLEPTDASVVNQVLHPGVAPLLAISVVALQGQDRLDQIQNVVCSHVTQWVSGAGEGLLLVVGPAHASTHVDIATPRPSVRIREEHQADVLGEQVHGVVTGHGDGHLELPGQVGGAVERFLGVTAEHGPLFLAGLDALDRRAGTDAVTEVAIHPEVEIGTLGGLRRQQIGDLIGKKPRGGVPAAAERGRWCHHVAVDVPAGREGGAHRAHDRADHLLEVGLGHPMHLEGLAGGGPKGAVAQTVG